MVPDNLTHVLEKLSELDLLTAARAMSSSPSSIAEASRAFLEIDHEIERDPKRDPNQTLRMARSRAEVLVLDIDPDGLDTQLGQALASDLLRSGPKAVSLRRVRRMVSDLDAGAAEKFDNDVSGADLRLVSGLDLRNSDRSELRAWAADDLSEEGRSSILEAGDLESGYLSYLALWWWRMLLVSYAVMESPNDEQEGSTQLATIRLSPEATALSAAALEPMTTVAQRFVDDPSVELDSADETFLRAELDILRSQHRVIEGADAFYVRRAVGRICQRLLHLQVIGEGARALLLTFDPEPVGVVDQIVEELREVIQIVADQWSDESVDPAADPIEAARPLVAAGEAADQFREVAGRSALLLQEAKEKFLLGVPDGAGKAVGAGMVGLAGTLAVGLAKTPGVDAIVLWLLEAIPRFVGLYTYQSASGEVEPQDDGS